MLYSAVHETTRLLKRFQRLALDYKSQHGLQGSKGWTTFPGVLHVPW